MRIDFHSHILPNIDDGAENVNESLKMLKMLKNDGVNIVVATPHLYLHKQSIDDFLKKREKSIQELANVLKKDKYPQVAIGAEVYFSTALNEMPLGMLCVAETNYLMIELPYISFSRAFLNSFADFINSCEHDIILAHVERYYDYNNNTTMEEILSYDILAQVNCDSFTSVRSRNRLIKLIKNNKIHLLGTDAHSMDRRPPLFGKAERIIRKKLSDNTFEKMMIIAENVLNNNYI